MLPRTVKAGDACASNYGGLNYACTADADCNKDQTIIDQTEAYFGGNTDATKGTYEKYYIGGVCPEKQVCCVPKDKKGAAGSSSAGTPGSGTDSSVKQFIEATYKKPPGYNGAIPDCAFSGSCRDSNDLVQVFINQGKNIFGFIGMIALAAFIYGGFLMVFSFGSADKVKQGRDVMVAAVVGIIIVFSAYLIVAFILSALGVSDEFKAIK